MQFDDRSVESSNKSSTADLDNPPSAPDWCLIVVADGEYPKLELFSDIGGLKARLQELDDKGGVNAIPIYGIPMAFTPGPYRFVYLPDGRIEPLFDFSPYGRFIPNAGAKPPIDRRFYLGPADDDVPDAIVDHRKCKASLEGTRKRKQERTAEFAAPTEEIENATPKPCVLALSSE
jgi:hypothetical protein